MKQVIFLILLFLIACTSLPIVEIVTEEGNVPVHVEVADEMDEWLIGLMHRRHLRADHGMLFVFPEVEPKSFWMKDTYISLDILFLDENAVIVKMHENVPPDRGPRYELYPSVVPIKYVLEVNAGFAEQHGVKEGDTVILPNNI